MEGTLRGWLSLPHVICLMTLTEQLTNHDEVLVDDGGQSSSRLQSRSQKHASPDDLHHARPGKSKCHRIASSRRVCLNHIRQLHVGIYFSYTHTKKKKCGATRLWIPHLPSLQLWRGPFLPFFLLFPSPSRCIGIQHVKQRQPFFRLKKKKKETGPPSPHQKRRTGNPKDQEPRDEVPRLPLPMLAMPCQCQCQCHAIHP